jgi:type IV secretory pathway TrbD component
MDDAEKNRRRKRITKMQGILCGDVILGILLWLLNVNQVLVFIIMVLALFVAGMFL